MKKRTALVLSSGGMFGAWQAGVWRALAGRVQPDLVAGASAGSINGWMIAGGAAPETIIGQWLDPGGATLMRLRLRQPPWHGFFDSRPLQDLIRRLASDWRPRLEIGIVAVELPRLRRRLFRNEEIGWRELAASCAILGGYESIRIGGRWYTDGGLLGALPLWAAVAMGAERIVAVNALPRMPSPIIRGIVRGCSAVARPAPPLPPGIELITILPDPPIHHVRDFLTWKRPLIESWVEQGARNAAAQWDSRLEAEG